MILSKFSIKRQITMIMIYLIVVGFGFFSLSQLKLDFFPEIQFPIIGIITNYPGVGPEDVENLVTRPIEEAVSAVKNVEKISSQSFKGTSIITMELKYGTDMDQAEVDVRKYLDFVRDFLPDDVNEPLVFAFDPSLTPIMFISLSSEYLGPAEIRRLAEDKIEALIERVEGVASVQTQGGLQRQINVYLNPVMLSAYRLTPDAVAQAIQFGSGLLPGGTIETSTKSYNLRVFSEYRSLDQISNTIVTYSGTQPIYVKDVATVEDGFKELGTEVRTDAGQGILMVISKQSDANTVLTTKGVKDAIPDLLSRLPEGTKFDIIWEQSDFILRSINNLTNSAFISFLFAFAVIYIFLRNWRGSLIMGISIPVSIIATFAVLYAFDLTLNIISMAGLALAVGMLVDNSIVVLENIYRHREQGYSLIDSAEKGASEVGVAITASTLTTVAVFLPVLFVPNITGQLFKDMVLTITFSLVVSLFIALSLVPLMASNILRKQKQSRGLLAKFKSTLEIGFNKLTDSYSKTLKWSIGHRKTVLGIVMLLFIGSIGLASFLGGEFLPKSDSGLINVLIETPAGSPLEQTRNFVYEIEDLINNEVKKDEVISVSFIYGPREGIGAFGTTSNTIEGFIKLVPKEQRGRSQFEIQDELRRKLENVPGISFVFQDGGTFSTERDIEVKVIGFDIEGAKSIANEIKDKMIRKGGFVDVDLNIKDSSPELQIALNKDVVNNHNLSTLQIASNISTAIQGRVVAQFRELGEEYEIRVQLQKTFREEKESIGNLQIALPTGDMVQLKSIATISEEQATPTIFRENQSRYVSVGSSLSGKDLSTATGDIKEIIESTAIPSDFQVIIGGTAEDQQEAFFYLGLAFLAAVLLVYMIMASQFESLVDPFIIMFTVPLSIIGVFIFLFITGTTISVMALVGIVMLVGIAVNNGIVLVDYINQLRSSGIELIEAVEKGSVIRMRPVLMTAMTTILGMVPLAIGLGSGSETWIPLARSVIGGLTATTFLTLLVIPILYIIFEKVQDKIKMIFNREEK